MTNILDTINALLPDNNTKDISEQDMRDCFDKTFLYNLKYQRGWDRIGNPDSLGDITHDDVAKTLTITPKTGQTTFDFWSGGNLYQRSSAVSVPLSVSATGSYYVLFDETGATEIKEYSTVHSADFMKCFVALYYYNLEDDVIHWAEDEQHGIILDPMAHYNLHATRGFQWVHGAEPDGFVDASDVFTSLSSGVFIDEDIAVAIPLVNDMPFGYKFGANGRWIFTAQDNKVGYTESGNIYVSYNKDTSGTWSLEESAATTDYIIYVIVATNLVDMPYFKAVGQQWYASRAEAREALSDSIHALNLSGLPGAEVKHIYAYICKRDGTLEDSGATLYETTVDLRGLKMT